MAEAGYSTDKPLQLTLTYANIYGTELGDQLRSQLKPIGIDLKVNVVEFSLWLRMCTPTTPSIFRWWTTTKATTSHRGPIRHTISVTTTRM